MPDFEMPYFVDGGGNKGYFKDTTAREQIDQLDDEISVISSGMAERVNLGTITASSNIDSFGKAWDALTIYNKPVIVHWFFSGALMALMFKYEGSQYGMAIAMKYNTTDVYTLSVNNGTKTITTK